MNTNYVKIFDTTLRDGEQSPGATMTSAEKLEVARALAQLGVDIIEAGFPAASPDDLEAVRRIAHRGGQPSGWQQSARSSAAWRAPPKPTSTKPGKPCAKRKHPRIHTFLATSAIHMKYKLKMDREQVVERVIEMVSLRAQPVRRCRVQPRRRRAQRPRIPVRRAGAGDQGRRDHAEHPRHGRLHHAR